MPRIDKRLAAAALALGCFCPSQALAADCSIGTQGVGFGDYDPFAAAPRAGSGSVTIACDALASYQIALSPGTGSYSARTMTGPAAMNYNLYTDAGRTIVWGDGNGGTALVSGSAANATHIVYGRIPEAQKLPAGTYSDLIQVTVTF